ncbi:LPS assembly lipoprotein LptE [uncultured Roseobacter sp.]|uniref:LPS assembly lipoprotein LptE n=1 Tax=uncultured Roseobacter sp. TaxID=114847 RepID=UPI00262FB5B6|nr:LPS assembly lipoprotein LptE [uncultured Roseobacter sp.]
MSLYSRRALICLPLALAACGFTPVYSPGGSGSGLQNRTLVDEPDTENGYLITRRIEERLGRAADPGYRLSVDVSTRQESLAVDREGDITRFNVLGTADYTLIDTASGRIVTSGSVDNFTGYSATGTTVATIAAEEDAQKRLMVLLADQVIIRLFSTDLT